ncbi:MAG: HEAT repeat domain-containing protein [Isosphaeraceae bacterium]
MRFLLAITIVISIGVAVIYVASGRSPSVRLAPGWKIELVAEAPEIRFPTAIVTAPDGTIYLGQDPMDMPGPVTTPADSVVSIKDGRITVFAENLWAVMGLEWVDDTLYVVHAPYLSAFRDTDHDGRADQRIDLATGLGPKVPGFNGINDHIASGIRLGIDGFLYISVGDKGIPRGIGRDGTTIRLFGGGVIRVRPDGTGLEIVSTGERNPLSVALSATDEIFTYGNDDDSKKWPNSLTHHIVGGHYGYPYEFLSAPDRALPIVEGRIGGAGAQGLCYNEDGLAKRFRGNLFFCDWGLQAVIRYEVGRSGGTFAVKAKEYIVRKGTLGDFRPFSLAVGDGGNSLYLVDWGFNGFLADGPKTGRLFRLTYSGRDRVRPSPRPTGDSLTDRLAALLHPALSVRLAAQRALAARGAESEGPLMEKLKDQVHKVGRLHALWALDSIGTTAVRRSILESLADADVDVRAQAARSVGIHRDPEAVPALTRLLGDPLPLVRREAAIALGRISSPAASPSLLASLGDPDRFAAWSIRCAIRAIGVADADLLVEALGEPGRRDAALRLCDEWWSVPVARALVRCLGDSAEPAWRARVVTTLAGLHRRYPARAEGWFGPNPLAGEFPRKTQDWDGMGMSVVFEGLAEALDDEELLVRRQAIAGLIAIGERALPALRIGLEREPDPVNLAGLARALGDLGDRASIPKLIRLLADPQRPNKVREAALESLNEFDAPEVLEARLALVHDPTSPASLVARAIASSGRRYPIPQAGLADLLCHPAATVRVAVLESLATVGAPLPEVRQRIMDRLNDVSPDVRLAGIGAVAALKVRESVPALLELAGDETYRAAATKALASMPDPRALSVYLDALDEHDPDVRQAGEEALRALRDSVGPELESRARSGQFTGPAALAVERILARFRPVTEWKLIGPFPRNTPPMFTDPASIDFARAHIGAEGRSLSWAPCRGDPTTGRVLVRDLNNGAGGPGGAGYATKGSPDLIAFAYTEIVADRDRPALIKLGSSGTITVTANGSVAFHSDHQSGRAYSPDSDTGRLVLKRGINRIVIRTRQGIGVWSFSVQLAALSDESSAPGSGRTPRDELRDYALTHPGDAKKGETFFFDPKGVGCVKCHAAAGRGTARIGPDLTGLALKYDKAEIVRSVLEPSNRIASGYLRVVVAKADGTVLSGLFRGESNTHLDLIGTDLTPVRIAKSAIDVRRVSETSLMPAGLVDSMTKHEFADLIAYLMTLTERPAILEAVGPAAD